MISIYLMLIKGATLTLVRRLHFLIFPMTDKTYKMMSLDREDVTRIS